MFFHVPEEFKRYNIFSIYGPQSAAGANEVHQDIWNALTKPLVLLGAAVQKVGSTAVTGVVAADFFLTRTTAIGTGGTALVAEDTTVANGAITRLWGAVKLPADVTARHQPTGGATTGAGLARATIKPEETSAGSYNTLSGVFLLPPVIVPPNSGLQFLQGSVASVGNFVFHSIIAIDPEAIE